MESNQDRLVELDAPPENEITCDAQYDKEGTKNDEVDVELGVLDIQFSKNGIGLCEYAHVFFVLLFAVQWFSVKAVDRLQYALKRVPETTETHHFSAGQALVVEPLQD